MRLPPEIKTLPLESSATPLTAGNPEAVIEEIHEDNGARGIKRDPKRIIDLCSKRLAPIAAEAGRAGTRDCSDDAVGSDPATRLVVVIADV
jgi:hypothetical protein